MLFWLFWGVWVNLHRQGPQAQGGELGKDKESFLYDTNQIWLKKTHLHANLATLRQADFN